jgi:8-oxo-dGTP diphosphatase
MENKMDHVWNCPALAVDMVIFNEHNEILLIRRGHEPFKDMYAFPGGIAEIGETMEQNGVRELLEETGLRVDPSDLTLVGVYSNPTRDPRRHNVSVAYMAHVTGQTPKAGDDAKTAAFMPIDLNRSMAFDHADILRDALRIKNDHPT